MPWWTKLIPVPTTFLPQVKRAEGLAQYKPFDTATLDKTFQELQSAVVETTALAGSISATLEERLTFTEQKLSTILFVLTEGVVVTDKTGVIKEWNPGAEIIWGYTSFEMIGKNISVIAGEGHGSYMKRFIESRMTASTEKQVIAAAHPRRLQCRHKDGRVIHVEVSVNVLPELDSSEFSFIAIVRDVTEKVNAEREREEQWHLLESIITITEDIVIVKDAIGRWKLMNASGEKLYNMTKNDYLGCTDEEIAYKFPKFRDAMELCMRTDKEAWTNRKPTHSEEVIVGPDGNKLYFDVVKTPNFDKDGHRHELVVVGRDVTQIKEKRQSITIAHKALNASSDMVCICDSEGYIVFANEKFVRTYRFIDYNDVIGKKMNIVRHPDTSIEIYEQLWATIKSGKIFQANFINKDKLGNDVRVRTSIMPMVNDDLSTPYFVCTQKLLD